MASSSFRFFSSNGTISSEFRDWFWEASVGPLENDRGRNGRTSAVAPVDRQAAAWFSAGRNETSQAQSNPVVLFDDEPEQLAIDCRMGEIAVGAAAVSQITERPASIVGMVRQDTAVNPNAVQMDSELGRPRERIGLRRTVSARRRLTK